MSAIRIVQVSGAQLVSVIDEATGLAEFIEVGVTEDQAAVDTIIEDDVDVSGRHHYSPTGRHHYNPVG
jgi:hypothetical protein